MSDLVTQIRQIADPLIAAGATHTEVRAAVWRELNVGIGYGGGGGRGGFPPCPYCGAHGGGGHGGLCPGGAP